MLGMSVNAVQVSSLPTIYARMLKSKIKNTFIANLGQLKFRQLTICLPTLFRKKSDELEWVPNAGANLTTSEFTTTAPALQ
jgi:hypothetical protein